MNSVFLRIVIGSLAFVLMAAVGSATTYNVVTGISSSTASCSEQFSGEGVGGSSSCVATYEGSDGITGSAVALARAGAGSVGVSAGAFVRQPDTNSGSQGGIEAFALAEFQDLIFMNVEQGILRLNFDVFGTLGQAANGGTLGRGFVIAYADFGSFAVGITDMNGFLYGDGTSGSAIFGLGKSYVEVPFYNGVVSFTLGMRASADCSIAYGGSCASVAEYYSSARVLASLVFDMNGNAVDNWFLSSDSGLDYTKGLPPHVSAVPLAPALAYLLSGFFGIIATSSLWKLRKNFTA